MVLSQILKIAYVCLGEFSIDKIKSQKKKFLKAHTCIAIKLFLWHVVFILQHLREIL
jgi:hypothetical protein